MKDRRLLFSETLREGEINVSPLIDIVFILLIFFVVQATFVEETGVEVERAKAASAGDLKKHSILIAITHEGRILYAGKEIGLRGVRGIVKRLLKQREQPVIVQADKRSSIDLYVRVHDEASLAGAKQIHLATLP